MTPSRADFVDPDDPSTWPAEARHWASRRAESLRGRTKFTSDLNSELTEREAEFRSLFGERKLVVYHCTRLLDCESTGIREEGLRPLQSERGLALRRVG